MLPVPPANSIGKIEKKDRNREALGFCDSNTENLNPKTKTPGQYWPGVEEIEKSVTADHGMLDRHTVPGSELVEVRRRDRAVIVEVV